MRHLVLPALLLATAFIFDRGWGFAALPFALTPQVFRGLCAVILGLSWRFRRGRVAWAALALVTAHEALLRWPDNAALATAITCLLALDLAVLMWLDDWPVMSSAGFLRAGILASQAAAVWALVSLPALSAWRVRLQAPLFELAWLPAVPHAALASFVLTIIATAIRLLRRPAPIEAGLAAALGATILAFSTTQPSLYYLATAGGVLTLSLLESAFSLAFEDGLTGLPTRRTLEERLKHLGSTYAIAMVDLDRFKKLNDRHGHQVGDQALRMVAGRLARVGGGGTAYRYGGEEFAIVFPGRTAEDAQQHLEALRQAIAAQSFKIRGTDRPAKKPRAGHKPSAPAQRTLKVTVSIGVAERNRRSDSPEDVLAMADKALYRAKKAGRNRVMASR